MTAPMSALYSVKHFNLPLTPDDATMELLAQAKAVRRAVFIEEQAVPEDIELDEYDATATHWLMTDCSTGKSVATARMVDYQEGCQMKPVAKIGRVAVLKEYRGKGLGDLIMVDILEVSKAQGYDYAVLSAQEPVIAFYERLGFEGEGPMYEEADIPHLWMRKDLR